MAIANRADRTVAAVPPVNLKSSEVRRMILAFPAARISPFPVGSTPLATVIPAAPNSFPVREYILHKTV
jgi:hypothetical protein